MEMSTTGLFIPVKFEAKKKSMLFFCIFFLFLALPSKSQVTVSLETTERNISPKLIGYNGRSTEGPSWENSDFLDIVEQLYPGMVRYPAGTQANYWDWRTGTFIAGSGKDAQYIITLETFTSGLPDSAGIVYVVNMARPTPATGIALDAPETVLKSDNTLQLKIVDMLEALEKFRDLNRFPEAVELGNELYFSNEHAAIYAGDPVFYINHAKKICQAIKAVYPELKILLCTTKGGTSGRDYWNETVFNALNSDPVFAGMVNGVVQHHYINEDYGDPAMVTTVASAQNAIIEGFKYVEEHISDYHLVPDQYPLWLTEYGATKLNAEGTWASGLRAVAMTTGWIKLGNKINRLFYHHITRDPDVINKDHMKKGPSGLALGLMSKGTNGKSKLRHIKFQGNPLLSGNIGALHGFKCWNNKEESVFLLNISSQTFTGISLDDLFTFEGSKQVNILHSETPYISNVYEGKNVSEQNFILNGSLEIKPFSITLITVKNTTETKLPEWSENIKVYPTIFNSRFTIEIPDTLSECHFQIILPNGRSVYSGELITGENVIYPILQPGFYFLAVKSNSGLMTAKIICQP